MKISGIKPYSFQLKPKSVYKDVRQFSLHQNNIQSFCSKKSENSDGIEERYETLFPNLFKIRAKIREEREEKIFHQFLSKEGKVSQKEYLYIQQQYPFIIDKAFDMVIENSFAYTTPTEMAKFAVNAKNYLDNCDRLKGKKYCIISIGTSPAPLTETLQNLGCDVVFLPISGIRFSHSSDKERSKLMNNQNLKLSLEYAKEKVKNLNLPDDTQFVVLDYAFSRKTLNTISELIAENNYLTKKENVWSLSLSELLNLVYKKEEVPLKIPTTEENIEQFLSEYDDDLYCSDFSPLCNVPHFYLEDERNKNELNSVSSGTKSKDCLFKEFDNYSKPLARSYSLCVLEMLNSLGEI